ncbi:MAG TPA: nuclear transport factor 2 family protein [Cyclobacteriaceae bacterium]|nr:nuclear transport factor 2 family protein [Cyclobacteriaceae bacterium]
MDYEAAKQYIINSEMEWGPALAAGDSSVTERIVANDFIGISSKGNEFDKHMLNRQTTLEANQLFAGEVYDVTVVFYGKAAVARGKETWTRLSDSTSTYNVWTDTWIYRNGKWQLVAAQNQKIDR